MRSAPKSSFTVTIPELHPGAAKIKSELKKWNYICAHRGWRKSSFCIHMVAEHLLSGRNAGWYADSFNVVIAANWIDFMKVSDGNEDWFNKSDQTWTIPGRGTCYFFSMEKPKSARGGTFDLAVGEEMGNWGKGIFRSIVEPVVRKANGTFIGIGTPDPDDPYNDFFNLIDRAKKHPNTHTSYVIPAWGADIIDGKMVEGVSEYSEYCLKDWPFPTFQSLLEAYEEIEDDPNEKDRFIIEYLCKFMNPRGSQFDGIDEVCTIRPELICV